MKNPIGQVVHNNGVAGRTVDDIRRTHKANGWRDTGYHFVIHEDGSIHPGRPLFRNGKFDHGAHVLKLRFFIGVCVIGNGNKRDFNPAQYAALRTLTHANMATFDFGPEMVIGHWETRPLVPPEFATKKDCPGRLVDMAAFRETLRTPLAVA